MFSNVFVCFFLFVCLSLSSSFCQFSFSSNLLPSPFYSSESIKEKQTEMASFLILPPFDRLASANSSNYIYVTLLTWQPDIHFSSVKWKGRFCLISFSFFFSSLLRSFFVFVFGCMLHDWEIRVFFFYVRTLRIRVRKRVLSLLIIRGH